MVTRGLPALDLASIAETRDALHAYSRVLGGWLKSSRPRRKHWWHASLRPSLRGLTTGVVRAGVDFELELDCVSGHVHVRTANGEESTALSGQSAARIAAFVDEALAAAGVDVSRAPGGEVRSDREFPGYDSDQAQAMQQALSAVSAALEAFRAGIREETSPIQLWPHHFDLSMIWLPGQKVPGQDPSDEEYSDKQMNFGFVFGDSGINEPYLYVTAYPLPDALPHVELPSGTAWQSEGFSGAVLFYKELAAKDDPAAYLQDIWSTLLSAGQTHLVNSE